MSSDDIKKSKSILESMVAKVNETQPVLDDKDEAIFKKREAEYNAISGPRVGDYVIFPDGIIKYFTHDWGNSIQTTDNKTSLNNTNFYLGNNGHVSYSGSLDPSIPKDKLVDTGEKKMGSCWFFHHNFAEANNGVNHPIELRVFKYVPAKNDQVSEGKYTVKRNSPASQGRSISTKIQVKAFKNANDMGDFLSKQTDNSWHECNIDGVDKSGYYAMLGGKYTNLKNVDPSVLAHI